jgi:hypothetical protein
LLVSFLSSPRLVLRLGSPPPPTCCKRCQAEEETKGRACMHSAATYFRSLAIGHMAIWIGWVAIRDPVVCPISTPGGQKGKLSSRLQEFTSPSRQSTYIVADSSVCSGCLHRSGRRIVVVVHVGWGRRQLGPRKCRRVPFPFDMGDRRRVNGQPLQCASRDMQSNH